MDAQDILTALGLEPSHLGTGDHAVTSPIDGSVLARLSLAGPEDTDAAVERAHAAFLESGAPCRRHAGATWFGCSARSCARTRARSAAWSGMEAGKILSEGLGEVQEMIDICDFAVGLSRQLYGLTIASERPGHRMSETWHPLGAVGVITAFNFPVAVWSWNTCVALVCGDPVVWKPSEKTPLTALACQALLRRAVQRFGAADVPDGLLEVVIGGPDVGRADWSDSPLLPLISVTGSIPMGKKVAPRVAARMGPVDPGTRRQQRRDRRPLGRS